MDKIWISYSLLGELSTAPWGVIDYTTEFKLNEDLWRSKLRPAANEGANLCRVLPFSLFGAPSPEAVFSPFVYNAGKWDLVKYNKQYFTLMRRAIEIAKSLGITIWLELFDNCGLWNEVAHLNPMTNNIQGVDALYGDNEYRQAYVGKMLSEFGDTVKWGLGNELSYDVVLLYAADGLLKGTQMFPPILKMFRVRGLKPFAYGADLDVAGEKNSNSVRKGIALDVEAEWDEDTKIQVLSSVHKAFENDLERTRQTIEWKWFYHTISYSDDGEFPRPLGDRWGGMIEYVLNNQAVEVIQFGQAGKSRLLFECCPETPEPHLIIRSMITKCEEFGVSFENKGKYPEIIPEPPKPPEPEKPKFDLIGEWNNNKWYILGGVALIVAMAVIIF